MSKYIFVNCVKFKVHGQIQWGKTKYLNQTKNPEESYPEKN